MVVVVVFGGAGTVVTAGVVFVCFSFGCCNTVVFAAAITIVSARAFFIGSTHLVSK